MLYSSTSLLELKLELHTIFPVLNSTRHTQRSPGWLLVSTVSHTNIPSDSNPQKAARFLYSTVSIVPRWLGRYLAMESVDPTAQNASASPLLRLPRELRDMIYSLVLSQDICIARTEEGRGDPHAYNDSTAASYGNVVQPLHQTNNLLALLRVCRQVNHEIPQKVVFKEVRFSFRQLLPPTSLRRILADHTILQLSSAQRACITAITIETFQFISMVDNWQRPIAFGASGLEDFLELLPELKHVEIVGYQRGFHRREMNREKVYTWARITKSAFELTILSSKPGVTITFREVDRLRPSYVDRCCNDWLGLYPQ